MWKSNLFTSTIFFFKNTITSEFSVKAKKAEVVTI